MRKAILACIVLTLALAAFGQHSKTGPVGGKITNNSKRKPKPTATPTPKPTPKAVWQQYTPCGVYYKDIDDFISDMDKGWRLITETDEDYIWYDSDRELCDDDGILKAWTKFVHRGAQDKADYSLMLYELKCSKQQLRLKTKVDYTNKDELLRSETFNGSWSDIIPDSAGERMFKTICRQN